MSKPDVNGMNRFHSTRAKFRRMLDGADYYGWVLPEDKDRLVIQSDSVIAAEQGEEFEVLLNCKASSSTFSSKLIQVSERRMVLTLPSLIRMDPPKPEARRKPPQMSGEILSPEPEPALTIIDVAPKGLGIQTRKSYTAGNLIEIQLHTNLGDITMSAQVVYCRSDENNEGVFRTGVHIESLARLDQARWDQLLAA